MNAKPIQQLKEVKQIPIPTILKTRDSDHLSANILVKNRFYPETNKLSFENFIVGFKQKYTKSGRFYGVNVLMSNGERS